MRCARWSFLFRSSLLLCAGCGAGDPPAKAALVPCLAFASDHEPIAGTSEFPAGGRWLGAAFTLGAEDRCTRLVHVWTAVDVGDAAPPGSEIARGELLLAGRRRGRLEYHQDGPLPVGRYRLEVLADDRPWRAVDFRVVADPAPVPVQAPRELLPLVEGVHWDYEFSAFDGSAPIAKATARVRIEVAEPDEDGQHLRFLRDGKLVHEEWWRSGADGLAATRRRGTEGEVVLDPPQVLLPFPLGALERWDYRSRDGSVRQSARCFGPRSLQGPEGPVPGYVVVVTDHSDAGEVSAERHFVPGYGLVREELVHSADGQRRLVQRLTILPAGASATK
jgi:hypothetical protein